MVTLYTINCPKCLILEKKLNDKKIEHTICTDEGIMEAKGFETLPMLEANGQIMNYGEAIKWVNERS